MQCCNNVMILIHNIQIFNISATTWCKYFINSGSKYGSYHNVQLLSRAGHLRYFLKNCFVESTYFFNAYPLSDISAPVLFKKPTPSHINLIENEKKNHFSSLKKFEKYRKCPALRFKSFNFILWRVKVCAVFCHLSVAATLENWNKLLLDKE